MQLEKIITLANKKVLLRFLAMERSLRATGCKLPLWVIPYDDDRFELPENAMWWPIPEISDWLKKEQAHPTCIKYQCLTTSNYQYVDSDVIFLQNPEQVLTEKKGFITSCGHWRHPALTVTAQSTAILRERSTHWMQQVFNAGQYACDRALYTTPELQKRCLDPRYAETCLQSKYLDQPGLNLLVHLAQVPIHNLTLPPYGMESTWAGVTQSRSTRHISELVLAPTPLSTLAEKGTWCEARTAPQR